MPIPKENKRHKWIAFSAVAFAIFLLSAMDPANYATNTIRRVLIDAGHGGKDPGNLGTGRYKNTEKNVTLDVSLKLGAYIKEHFPEVEVFYTRTDDSFPTLEDRVKKANNGKADLFISIHCDAFTKPTAKGSGTYVMGMHKSEESLRVAMQENASIYLEDNYKQNYAGFDPKDPDTYIILSMRQNVYLDHSLNLSQKIQNQFRDRVGRVDRGVRQAGYYVISFTTMPSVLVELGFLTNQEEEDFLNSEKGKTYMASAIFRAFKEYKAEIEEVSAEVAETPAPTLENEEKPNVPNSVLPLAEHNEANIQFAVQFLTSSKKLKSTDEVFKGLGEVKEIETNGMYKYTTEYTTSYDNAKKNQIKIREMGYPGAFIVAFKGEERLDLQTAIRLTTN